MRHASGHRGCGHKQGTRLELGLAEEDNLLMTRKTVRVWVWMSAVCFCATAVAWAVSYWNVPVVDESSGAASAGPELRMPLLVPSDAEEYLALAEGRVEGWEYAPWERKWYPHSWGMGLWVPAAIFAGLPAWWMVRGRRQGE